MNQVTGSEHREGFREITNVPNTATLVRLLIAGHVSYVLLGDGPSFGLGLEYAGGMLLDAFDGWYARKFHKCTKFGKVFDPIVDFASFHLPLLAYGVAHTGGPDITQSVLPIISSVTIASRDILLYQQYLSTPKEQRDEYHASRIGKVKTAVQMATVTALITLPESSQAIQHNMEAIQDWIIHSMEGIRTDLAVSYAQVREMVIEGGLSASISFSLFSGFGYWKKIREKMEDVSKSLQE